MEKPVYYAPVPGRETAFSVAANAMKFGPGILAELGGDAVGLGMKRVALFVDEKVKDGEAYALATEALRKAGVDFEPYSAIKVEPTDRSFIAAAEFARDGNFDGFVSLGGGSTMDTCKAANLYATWPDEFLAYVNLPFGKLKPVPGPLKPHIACPTTSGTGSECTANTVVDLVDLKVKTAISHRYLKPSLAVVDPTTTHTMPAGVIAATGFDVLTHAIESYTARPYTTRQPPATPAARPAFQGANPYSDVGSLEAIRIGGKYLVAAVNEPDNLEARYQLMFAATLAGMAFGNAGVHLPHAMSYSVAGMNHTYVAKGYENDNPMVPHGIAVVINAPAAFRFTAPAAPERHLAAAEALGADIRGARLEDAGEILAARLIQMMKATGLPNGLNDLGYTEADLPGLVKGGYAQPRLLVIAPRETTEKDMEGMYRDGMRYW